jgi:DNA-binding response OmpR family regulator
MPRYALIADPDVTRASLYAAIISQQGLHPASTRDGMAACALLLDRGPPALAVVDLSLERVDGFELIERLRKAAIARETAILAVSDQRDLRDAATSLRNRYGIGAILAKAASEESVRRVIRRLLLEVGFGAAEDAPPPGSDSARGADSGRLKTDAPPASETRSAPTIRGTPIRRAGRG